MTDAKCAFSIPNMTDEWYGFFEKPSMQIDSIEKVATKTWRVKANARAAYCANFCRSPQLRFAFSFRPNGIGADNSEEDNNNDDGNDVKEGGRIEGLVGIDINENVPSATTSAKLNGSNRKVSIRNLSRSFRNQQQPIHAFCDEYGAQYRTHLTVQISLQFDVDVDGDEENIIEKSFSTTAAFSSSSTAASSSSSNANAASASSSTICNKDAVEERKEEKSTSARNLKEQKEVKVEKEKEEEKELECCVCLDARATMMNETCKHTVMCHTCAFAFLSRSKELQQPYSCPICRAKIGNMYIETKTI